MKLFLHTLTRIRIINNDLEYECTPEQFALLEPDYPGLPTLTNAPAVVRYQTPEWTYVEDSTGAKHADAYNALPYCDNIAAYQGAAAVLWIHYALTPQAGDIMFQADNVPLMRNSADDVLRVTATVRAGDDPEAPIIEQLTHGFPIRMCTRDGREAFIKFVAPVSPGVFQIDLHFAGKQPVRHQLFDADLAPVTMGGITHAFRQVTPLILDVYEV